MPQAGGTPLFADSGVGPLRLLFYLAAAIALMVADHRGGFLREWRTVASLAAEPLYWAASAPVRAARAIYAGVADRSELATENGRLQRELLIANARLRRLEVLQEENRRLRALLGSHTGDSLSVQLARPLDVDFDPFRHRISLDIGTRQGVRERLALIDASGVVGQVIAVGPLSSTAMLITDPNHALPVQVARSGLRAIVFGTGRMDRLTLPNIPPGADIQAGDVLITSGLGGTFPAGFPVGRVVALQPDEARLFVIGEVEPAAALNRSSEFLLVWSSAGEIGPPAERSPSPAPTSNP